MARILALPTIEALIFDLDLTLYYNEAYKTDCDRKEIAAMSQSWSVSFEEAENRFSEARKRLASQLGAKVSRNETAKSLGFSTAWWNRIRERDFSPENFLKPDHQLNRRMIELTKRYKIAVASNSPTRVVQRVLQAIGLAGIKDQWTVLGTNDALPKPNSDIYRLSAERMQVSPQTCLSIGDREEMDGWPAMRLGMGAVIIDGVDDLISLLDNLLTAAEYRQNNFDISRLLDLYRPGQVTLCGFTGQAGAGKTTNADLTQRVAEQIGIPTVQLSLDYFFRKSSRNRKAWLEEGKRLGPEQYQARADQMSWWDFDRAKEALFTLAQGHDLRLRGVYNRQDKGELSLDIDIPVPGKGLVVVCEGVAIAHMSDYFSRLVYLHAHRDIRSSRLNNRDTHRKGPEAEERFRLTEDFERRYFGMHMHRAHMFVDNGRPVPAVMSTPPSIDEL